MLGNVQFRDSSKRMAACIPLPHEIGKNNNYEWGKEVDFASLAAERPGQLAKKEQDIRVPHLGRGTCTPIFRR